MRVKYQRTSSIQQKGDRFLVDKSSYELILFDQGVSGTLSFKKRPQASKLIPLVENGQVHELVVEEIRDVGRNMYDTIATLGWLDHHKVNVVIRSMGNLCSRVNGRPNEIWMVVTATLSSLYNLELESLKNRTRAGREAYLLKGGKWGRPVGSNESRRKFLEKPNLNLWTRCIYLK